MTGLFKLVSAAVVSCLAVQTLARGFLGRPTDLIVPYKRGALQDIVTWDEHSVFIHGKRVFLYSAEFHPWRLPVPDLWFDIFQKIKGMGYNCVSFYVDWALLEGKPGHYEVGSEVFDYNPFFEAAQKAGIYLIARPGPYINAEASGGGFPGWLQRTSGMLRTADPAFLNATENYVAHIGKTIADAQITNGGPVIMVQPENEYTVATSSVKPFPDPKFFAYVQDQLRRAGIVVPLINNDASPKGYFAPGQEGAVDIYGHDGYPLGFNCANPETWPDNALPTNWGALHKQQSPSTPYSILEFQAGSFDPWGGPGFDKCEVLVNAEFERVFYKNLYSFGVTVLNLYMTYGGTNWGNLGHPGGYTSYDYSAPIREDRRVDREKYSEQKLQANFFKVTPSFLTSTRGTASTSWTSTSALTVTPAFSNSTKFYFLRHTKYNSREQTSYKLTVQTKTFGNITVPQTNGSLVLNGRDSKVHVSDYDVGGLNIVYSTGEIYTWHKYPTNTVVLIYGGPGETHELAVQSSNASVIEGTASVSSKKGYSVINWQATGGRKIVQVNRNVYIYLLDRYAAYNYWSVDQAPHDSSNPVILQAGYLVRTAKISGSTLSITGDMNSTTSIEIIGGAPSKLSTLTFNDEEFDFSVSKTGTILATIDYPKPKIPPIKLNELKWRYLDTLPEISPKGYDDSAWTKADLNKTYNTLRRLTTPTSLYASDYGYHTGTLVFRGHFTATGYAEKNLALSTQGGSGFGMSVWLNSTFLGSFTGFDAATNGNSTFPLPNLITGKNYVITVVIDSMGLDQVWTIGTETMKNPRGILDYTLSGRTKDAVTWKLTGNLGGEDFRDRERGPLNEGGLYAERHGFHQPGAPTTKDLGWVDSEGPVKDGIKAPGIGFFVTDFELPLPSGYDISLAFKFANSTAGSGDMGGSRAKAYRVQIYVNGWQFGKYVNNVGPQTKFPVPEGVLRYRERNWVGVSLWGLEKGEVKIEGLELQIQSIVWGGVGEVKSVGSRWKKREDAY